MAIINNLLSVSGQNNTQHTLQNAMALFGLPCQPEVSNAINEEVDT